MTDEAQQTQPPASAPPALDVAAIQGEHYVRTATLLPQVVPVLVCATCTNEPWPCRVTLLARELEAVRRRAAALETEFRKWWPGCLECECDGEGSCLYCTGEAALTAEQGAERGGE